LNLHFSPSPFSKRFNNTFESYTDSLRANQYGNVTTPSYAQCAGPYNNKAKDFEIRLTTNTALNNLLDPSSIHFLSGKFILLNNGLVPTLTYVQEITAIACPSSSQPFSFTNKVTFDSLGLVVSREEIVLEGMEGTSHLEVVMSHNDWDLQVSTSGFMIDLRNNDCFI
jgi:hypothetical protein